VVDGVPGGPARLHRRRPRRHRQHAGAALGGFAIGFLSAWSDQYISARWTNALVFAILILVLVFRPQGLLGERTPDKM
jgi:branched-subunit amino acid ABC-type transport system permease component